LWSSRTITPSRHNPRLIPFNQDFSFEIVLRNTGSCDWPDGVRLHFNSDLTANPDESVNLAPLQAVCADAEIRPGVNFARQQQSNFYFDGGTAITEDTAPVTLMGTAPNSFGCYYSVWDVIYPGTNLPIGRPLVLAIRVWGAT
jgi:hypothetical protein